MNVMTAAEGPEKSAQVVSIDEATELYPEEHIIMRVKEFDGRGNPLDGVVVVHGLDPEVVSQEFSEIDSGKDFGEARYAFFTGYGRIHTIQELVNWLESV